MDLLRSDSYLALAKAINRHPTFYVEHFEWDFGLERLTITVYGRPPFKNYRRPAAVAQVPAELLEGEEPDAIAELYIPIFHEAIEVLLESVS